MPVPFVTSTNGTAWIPLLLKLLLGTLLIARCANGLSFGFYNGGSDFFVPIQQGFEASCNAAGVTCHFVSHESKTNCSALRREAVEHFLEQNVSGIAMKPCSPSLFPDINEIINEAGVPVVTFDSDAPDSNRIATVGTDEAFFGRTMARLLRQLRPEGGTYALIGVKAGRTEAFVEEIQRYNDREDRGHWYESERLEKVPVTEYPYMDDMEDFAPFNPSAMITFRQTPMRHPNWTQFVDRNRHRNITYIGTDGADYQLDYLNRRYVDGLVGQLPYEIGTNCFNVLMEHYRNGYVQKTYYPTNVVAYNLIPLELPPLDVDENLLGNRKYLGFVGFGMLALAAVASIVWTVAHRANAIVKASQPFFLIMVAAGILVMASSLIPLSFDDGGRPDENSEFYNRAICMSVPWLAFTGFALTFSALFSKTWRVNQIFHAKTRHARLQVTEKDVLGPFVILLTCNFAILVAWTIEDPLTYIRQENEGTDYWNRVISTYGACRSDNVVPFVVPLAVINFGLVSLACWQAIEARDVALEFSESKYIGLTVGSLFQAFLTGIPLVVVVRDQPHAYYTVLSTIFILLCSVVLMLIFLPKILLHRSYAGQNAVTTRRRLNEKIQQSQRSVKWSSDNDPSSLRVHESGEVKIDSSASGSAAIDSRNAAAEKKGDDSEEKFHPAGGKHDDEAPPE